MPSERDRACTVGVVLVIGLALLLSGCVYFSRRTLPGACLHDMGSPMRNFCVVTPGVLWRGESPSRADARWLVQAGVGTVISLELDVRQPFESAKIDPHLSRTVSYFRVRDFSAVQVLTHHHLDEHVALVLAIIKQAPKPVLISCRAGVDRTGVIAAAYRMLVEGASEESAIKEMEGFHSPWDPLNARYVRSLTGARAAAIRRNVRNWQHRVDPSGVFDCQDGECIFHRLGPDASVSSAPLSAAGSPPAPPSPPR